MAGLGNSGGKNKGKKYKKLTGYEMATPESEARAGDFMKWYGANFESLKRELFYKGRVFDDQIATDTALLIYDAIALKGAKVESYKHYFFMAYHTNAVKGARAEVLHLASHLELDASTYELPASSVDLDTYEREVDIFSAEVLEYVREWFSPFDCSIFEIYIGLHPETSYNKLSALLGIPRFTIYTTIGIIRKELAAEFAQKRNYLRTLI